MDCSKEIQEAIKQLPKDKIFQYRFGHDKKLDELQDERFNKKSLVRELQAFKNCPLQVGNLKFSQMTIDAWSNLWALDSPFALGIDKISQADIDLLLAAVDYHGDDLEELVKSSIDFCKKREIPENIGIGICNALINLAFSPLKLFPDATEVKLTKGQQPLYDAEWISSLISAVHQVTGAGAEKIRKQMSLNSVCHYYVEYAKSQGMKNIGKKSEPDIIQEMDVRSNQLIVERLIEKGIIKEEDKEYYETLMLAPSKRPAGFKIREP